MASPSRGEVWFADFGTPVGREAGMRHPCLIISDNRLNHGPAELAIVLPITSVYKGSPSHFEVNPPEGGLQKRLCYNSLAGGNAANGGTTYRHDVRIAYVWLLIAGGSFVLSLLLLITAAAAPIFGY